jgi:hypothetical protein
MSINPSAVYVFAPQGAGKSTHAAELAERFGCTTVVDDWDGTSEVPAGALVLGQVATLEAVKGAHGVFAVDVQADHVVASGDFRTRRCRAPYSSEFRDCLCPPEVRSMDDCRHPA